MFALKRKSKPKTKRGVPGYSGPAVYDLHQTLHEEPETSRRLIKLTITVSVVAIFASLSIGLEKTGFWDKYYSRSDIFPATLLEVGEYGCGQNNEETCYHAVYRYGGVPVDQTVDENLYRALQGKTSVNLVTVSNTPYIAGTEPGKSNYRLDLLCACGVGLFAVFYPLSIALYKRL